MSETPIVSVIMSAAATEQGFFEESVQSVLDQTFADFEFIIVDDGLSESNRRFLEDVDDPRLVLIVNERNLGQSKSVNKALGVAAGAYAVRMDADDVMLPERIAIEVAYMEERPEVVAAGGMARKTSDNKIVPRRYPDGQSLEVGMAFSCDMVHPTMVIRRDAVANSGLRYDEEQLYAQDYMFWFDASCRGEIGLIPEVVLNYRIHGGQVSSQKLAAQCECARRARKRWLQRLGFDVTRVDQRLLEELVLGMEGTPPSELRPVVRELRRQAKERLGGAKRGLFLRELSWRVLKSGVRRLVRDRRLDVFLWGDFWRALLSVWNWRFYIQAVR